MAPLKLPCKILGAPKGAPYLVTLAGFPDDEMSGFKHLLWEFSSSHRIIACCFPGFESGGAKKLPKWGYDLETLREAMHETLASVAEEEGQFTFNLVIHDWGSVLGLMYANKYPERVESIVCFDEVDVRMCYPYIQFYFGKRGYFRVGPKKMTRPRFPSGIPVCFLFGRKKNTMFHTDDFLSQLDETPGCRWKSYDAGHWLQEGEHKDEIVEEMRDFMKLKSK